jgi:hypothetical protein
MKKIISSSILLAAAVSAGAAPLVTIGDQLDLFFKGSVVGKWDSNITTTSANKLNDYSAVFRLGAEADYGRNSKFKANVKFYEDLTRYASEKQFNSNLAHVAATASYVEANYSIKANFAFDQRYQNTSTAMAAGELVRFNNWVAGIDGSYDFSEKVFGELGFNWARTEYLGKWASAYSNNDIYNIPLSILYRVTSKISVGLSYQYRHIDFSGGAVANSAWGDERDDHFGGLTVRGDILPKLNVSAYAGVQYRDIRHATVNTGEDLAFALKGTVSYELTEKIGLFATGRRDFGNGASRQSSVDTGCEVGANYAFNQFVTFTTSFTYTYTDYEGIDRKDDEYCGRVGVTYKPNKFLTLGANYRYLDNASNVAAACYMQHLVDISVSIKY